jgi:hypothetical protein
MEYRFSLTPRLVLLGSLSLLTLLGVLFLLGVQMGQLMAAPTTARATPASAPAVGASGPARADRPEAAR